MNVGLCDVFDVGYVDLVADCRAVFVDAKHRLTLRVRVPDRHLFVAGQMCSEIVLTCRTRRSGRRLAAGTGLRLEPNGHVDRLGWAGDMEDGVQAPAKTLANTAAKIRIADTSWRVPTSGKADAAIGQQIQTQGHATTISGLTASVNGYVAGKMKIAPRTGGYTRLGWFGAAEFTPERVGCAPLIAFRAEPDKSFMTRVRIVIRWTPVRLNAQGDALSTLWSA